LSESVACSETVERRAALLLRTVVILLIALRFCVVRGCGELGDLVRSCHFEALLNCIENTAFKIKSFESEWHLNNLNHDSSANATITAQSLKTSRKAIKLTPRRRRSRVHEFLVRADRHGFAERCFSFGVNAAKRGFELKPNSKRRKQNKKKISSS